MGRRADDGHLVGDVGAEQRAAHDLEGQRRHVGRDVELLTVVPLRRARGRQLDGVQGVGRQAARVEGGLHQPPLPAVQVAASS